ncbi:MAG: hypothetical protein RJA17_1225, partial [Pseudomonadota bacterium]
LVKLLEKVTQEHQGYVKMHFLN